MPQRKGTIEVNEDEFPKPDTSLSGLQSLRPAFIRDASGTVTAGNASGINDGAAAITLASESVSKTLGLAPIARVISYAQAGVDPAIMGMGPVPAVQAAVRAYTYEHDMYYGRRNVYLRYCNFLPSS